ncbi:NAD(P)H-binding protein [Gordonia sp. SL306]|uniref:NAD(P)H-binding protein n=1 Tax=Gordonia sp. SL306 TaxID=2995145 RepID=UPI00226ED53C|nr:NAD(P)H-binding protein [Gordonia sp. SL306]WAC57054.1 NAD(P)H-binding protein [Gordonia sp. SL306]
MRVLVTGATGYVGSRLVCALVDRGDDVVVTSRRPDSLRRFGWYGRVTAIAMDAGDSESAHDAVARAGDIDALYFLVHGIGQQDFDEADTRAAHNVAVAARAANVPRIVYLGGFVPDCDHDDLSRHLRSRAEVGAALDIPGGPDLVWLRAAVILGAGSTSFEIIRYVADRLAVIPQPGWVDNAMDPISVRDVIHYLVEVVDPTFPAGAYDIAGPDVGARYESVLSEYIRAIRQPRLRLPVPFVNSHLAGRVTGMLVPVPSSLTADLVASLSQPMTASEHSIRGLVPEPPNGLIPMREAIESAVHTTSPRSVCALADPHHLADTDPGWAGGDLMRIRRAVSGGIGSIVGFTTRRVRGVVSLLSG